MTEQFARDFKGIWIPKEIWLNKTLSFFEKCLLAEIHSLNGPEGCYASNQYFCEFFDVKERTLSQALTKLKNLKLIEVVAFNGRTRVIKTIYANFYGSGSQNFTTLPSKKLLPSTSRVSLYEKIEDNKEPPNPLKGEPPDGGGGGIPFYTSKDKSVKMLQTEYDALVKENGQDITDACIQRLSEWKEENPALAKKRKNDYRCILRWVLLAVKEKQAREKKLAAAETPKSFPMQPPSKQTPPPPSDSAENNRQEFMHFRNANWKRSKETQIYLEDRVTYCQIGKLKVLYEDKNFFNAVIAAWQAQLEGK